MPYRREAEVVLAMWRELQDELRFAPDGSEAAATMTVALGRLREEYERLIEQARKHGRPEPEPPPWQDSPG
jgi:hypothetical protein